MKCEKLNITGITPKTCIERQKLIAEKTHLKGIGKNWGWNGSGRFLELDACIGCKKGLAFYNEELRNEKAKV
jgi:hypothetical protein